MSKTDKTSKALPPTIAELYPQLSLREQREAEYFLRRYVKVMRRIFERKQKKSAIDESRPAH